MRIRYVKTASGKYAVQVVSKHNGKLTVHKHIGSYATDREKTKLIFEANLFIRDHDIQPSLFAYEEQLKPTDIQITSSKPLFLYHLLSNIYDKLGLHVLNDEAIKDVILARIYQPVSKRETADILADVFGKEYSLKTIYRHLKSAIDEGLKEKFQTALIHFAKTDLHDTLRLVFYDVTTLAFDSQVKKGLKDFGFSKDHRFHDVQIVIGLVVNKDGFPLYFDVFNGKTFEGKTFIAVVENIRNLLKNPEMVVIADAAMISRMNVEELDKRSIGFIVGARLRNLPSLLQEEIANELHGKEEKTITVFYLHHRLICQYLSKRAAKDKADREKQLEKAERIIANPSQMHGRFRFVETTNGKYSLNEDLVEKAEKLEGIKGYLTNTDLDEKTVIDRYHDLWRVERSFRITKSDLEARPIFLQLDKTILCHVIIVFAALAISRYLEMKTNMSIHQIVKVAQRLLTHEVTISNTGQTGYVETTIHDPEICGQLEILRKLEH